MSRTDYPTALRPIVGHPSPLKINLVDLGILSPQDLTHIMKTAQKFCKRVTLDSPTPDSTLESPDDSLTYSIASGELISKKLPEVYRLYEETLPELVRSHVGLSIVPSKYPRTAVTLNLLSEGERYELHVDSNSVTGLLYINTLLENEGGALRLYYPGRKPLDIQPVAGDFLLYDARWVPHEVLSVRAKIGRLSLPMNYFLETDIELRPDLLDNYLFGDKT